MAFGFLQQAAGSGQLQQAYQGISSGPDIFSSILSGLPGILGAIRGGDSHVPGFTESPDYIAEYGRDPFNRPMTPAEEESIALYKALSDPDNTLVQSLAEEGREEGARGLRSDIRSFERADRRAKARGRSPTFFDPETRDETIAYLMSRGQAGMGDRARRGAREQIGQTAAGLRGLVPTQSGRQAQEFRAIGQDIAARELAARQLTPQVQQDRYGDLLGGVGSLINVIRGQGRTPGYGPQASSFRY